MIDFINGYNLTFGEFYILFETAMMLYLPIFILSVILFYWTIIYYGSFLIRIPVALTYSILKKGKENVSNKRK